MNIYFVLLNSLCAVINASAPQIKKYVAQKVREAKERGVEVTQEEISQFTAWAEKKINAQARKEHRDELIFGIIAVIVIGFVFYLSVKLSSFMGMGQLANSSAMVTDPRFNRFGRLRERTERVPKKKENEKVVVKKVVVKKEEKIEPRESEANDMIIKASVVAASALLGYFLLKRITKS